VCACFFCVWRIFAATLLLHPRYRTVPNKALSRARALSLSLSVSLVYSTTSNSRNTRKQQKPSEFMLFHHDPMDLGENLVVRFCSPRCGKAPGRRRMPQTSILMTKRSQARPKHIKLLQFMKSCGSAPLSVDRVSLARRIRLQIVRSVCLCVCDPLKSVCVRERVSEYVCTSVRKRVMCVCVCAGVRTLATAPITSLSLFSPLSHPPPPLQWHENMPIVGSKGP
jgi:hypothetical protein